MPEAQQVELHEADRRAVVLVPLEHGAQRHASRRRRAVAAARRPPACRRCGPGRRAPRPGPEPAPLDRAHLDDGPVADDHAPRVDAQVPGRPLDLAGQRQHRLGDVVARSAPPALLVRRGRHGRPHVHLLRPGVLLAGRVAQRLGHVAHRRAGPVADDVGHLGRVPAAVAAVDVLDGLLPPAALDVDVDVGGAVALGRQEPLEQQPERHRVGVGDAERVADRRVGGAAPALAVDVGPAAELDDVPHHEEVAGEPQRLDDRELVVDLGPGLAVAVAVAVGGRRRPGARSGGRRPPRPGGAGRSSRRGRRGTGTAGAAAPPAPGRRRRPVPARPPARPPRASGRSAGPARRPSAGGRRRPPAASRPGRRGCAGPAPRPARWPAAAGRAWRSGRCWWPPAAGPPARPAWPGRRCGPSRAGRRGRTARPTTLSAPNTSTSRASSRAAAAGPSLDQRPGHRSLAAPGEHQPVAAVGRRPVDARVVGPALLAPRQVPGADGGGQPGVALGVAGQHQQVVALGVGLAVLGTGQPQRQLGPEHGGHAHRPGRLGEADHPVEPVVVGEGQRLEAEAGGLLRQLLGVAGAVEEAEVRVAVQLGVGGG